MDESAHEITEDVLKECQKVIEFEMEKFKGLNATHYNKIFMDIDQFILDEKNSEESIFNTFSNF